MSRNNGQGADAKPVQSCSSGFFGKMFGGSGEKKANEQCPGGCGQDKCNCNCELKNHLKQCCGLGQLPPLVVCPKNCPRPATPPCPQPACPAPVSSNCGCPKADTVPAFKPNTSCPPKDPCGGKCPPMPCSDTSGCIPTWLCTPSGIKFPTYPAPCGAVILPISNGGRNSSKQGGCGSVPNLPNVANKDCPMVRPRCPGLEKNQQPAGSSGGGFFSKIGSMFGGK